MLSALLVWHTQRVRYLKSKHTFCTFSQDTRFPFYLQLLIFHSVFHLCSISFHHNRTRLQLNNTIACAQYSFLLSPFSLSLFLCMIIGIMQPYLVYTSSIFFLLLLLLLNACIYAKHFLKVSLFLSLSHSNSMCLLTKKYIYPSMWPIQL